MELEKVISIQLTPPCTMFRPEDDSHHWHWVDMRPPRCTRDDSAVS